MIQPLRAQVERMGQQLRERVAATSLDACGPEAFAFAFALAELHAAEALIAWSAGRSSYEQALTRLYLTLCSGDQTAGASVGALLVARGEALPDPGLAGSHQALKQQLDTFAAAQIAPLAEALHRDAELLPESLLSQIADLGLFGISIPEPWGAFTDHLAMLVATESLSRASLGAGGSVLTRPEICAKALLAGGTRAQQDRWLPGIASGAHMVAIAVTEPDAGSDVATLRVSARPVEGGWRLNGEKTWCTFGGRADLLVVLARTGGDGHRGLTLFLVDKPTTRERQFEFAHKGGRISGAAIPTLGYRGMHSFTVHFDDWFVPDDQRIGDVGRGFYLMMQGFAGGRIQTAARAVGVMEAAFVAAVSASERQVFGAPLARLALTQARLAQMAARLAAARQLSHAVAARMDDGDAAFEAALAKLLACREAEWVTRMAMQLHGGLGYSEECAVSRYWQDARVLSIFEGAEEVLAIRVIARTWLQRADA